MRVQGRADGGDLVRQRVGQDLVGDVDEPSVGGTLDVGDQPLLAADDHDLTRGYEGARTHALASLSGIVFTSPTLA